MRTEIARKSQSECIVEAGTELLSSEAQHEAVVDPLADNPKGRHRRCNITVVDLGVPNPLCFVAGSILRSAPTCIAPVDFNPAENPQRIDPAPWATPRSADSDLARSLIHRRVFERHIDRHDLRYQTASELGPDAASLASRVPCAKEKRGGRNYQQRRCVAHRSLREALADFALHEWLFAIEAVAQDRIVDTMRRIQRSNLCNAFETCIPEVHDDVRDRQVFVDRLQQAFFQPIGLELYAVDKDTPYLRAAEASPLENMHRRRVVAALTWVGGWKYLVALPPTD